MRWMLTGLVVTAILLSLQPGAAQEAPRVDVAFLLDATGSMGDEIDAVKEKIREMISEIALGDPPPDVRFGIVAYRDRGDEYVTVAYDLTRDIDQIVENLDQIRAVIDCMKSRRKTDHAPRHADIRDAGLPAPNGSEATLQDLESQHIAQLLQQYHGNRRQAATAGNSGFG